MSSTGCICRSWVDVAKAECSDQATWTCPDNWTLQGGELLIIMDDCAEAQVLNASIYLRLRQTLVFAFVGT